MIGLRSTLPFAGVLGFCENRKMLAYTTENRRACSNDEALSTSFILRSLTSGFYFPVSNLYSLMHGTFAPYTHHLCAIDSCAPRSILPRHAVFRSVRTGGKKTLLADHVDRFIRWYASVSQAQQRSGRVRYLRTAVPPKIEYICLP